ncbi:SpoIIE family protein phosphatase [Spirillospora sp. NPDC047279]|uniref:GAF domain-containing SpoIIE family protein phosphatase n=1 Tax=Spirillospora sp. NPDC047279 TaxID=3155478 RepID=UPI0034087BF2
MASPFDGAAGPGREPADPDGAAGRLEALAATGLSAAADAEMDRFARLAASVLGVPVALVSLVEADRQVFPGMLGLADPWGSARSTPLTHSLCRHVTASGEPLVLPDVREDERTRESAAIADLNVVAYAGMPLTDGEGHVLGSLSVIDTVPRDWTGQELQNLRDLAAACSAELRLRILSAQAGRFQERAEAARGEAERARRGAETAVKEATQAQEVAESAQRVAESAQALAERTTGRAEDLERQSRVALGRSQLLLRAAEDLADTTGLEQVRRRVTDLVSGDLKPAYVGLVLVEGRRLRRVVDSQNPLRLEAEYESYGLGDAWPTAQAAREGRVVIVPDREALVAGYSVEAVAGFDSLGLASAVCMPLLATRPVPGGPSTLGALVLGWASRHDIDVVEQAVLAGLAVYTGQAVERALFVDERVGVAHKLQMAMLTELPEPTSLDWAAVYRPAADAEMVGGDWYDAYPLPDADPAARRDRRGWAVTVGDITGHDMNAAAIMGQTRAMLRQADIDHPGQDPARAVTALEKASEHLGLNAGGTLVHAHLRPAASAPAGGWTMTWTNAGHPPPLLVSPEGAVVRLEEHDHLLSPGLRDWPRTTHRRVLPPGALLLLYTDGLVERRTRGFDVGVDQAEETLRRLLAGDPDRPLPVLLSSMADQLSDAGGATEDDVVLMAVRIPRPGPVEGPAA